MKKYEQISSYPTPGLWKITEGELNGRWEATVWSPDTDATICRMDDEAIEHKANANLIAAAQDLLTVIMEMVQDHESRESQEKKEKTIRKAYKAIRKAKGIS
jgi:hypothetical protein